MLSKFRAFIIDTLHESYLLFLAVLGIALIIGAFVVPILWIPNLWIAVTCASAMAIAGMAILCKLYFKHEMKKEFEKIEKLKLAGVREHEANESREKQLQNQLEKERLERMRIDVTTFSPMLNMGLVSVNVSLHDFVQEIHRDQDSVEGLIIKDQVNHYEEYVGVVHKRFNAQLGIDLKKLRFSIQGNKILVSGIASEFQGYKDVETKWLLREMRKRRAVDGEVEYFELDFDDSRIQSSMIKQEKTFHDKINIGLEFKNLDSVIQEMARNVISLILSPLKMELVFVNDLKEGKNLLDFIRDRNEEIEKK